MDDLSEKPRIRALEAFPTQQNGQQMFVLRDPFHYSDAILTLTPGAALIVRLLDGTNSILDIQTILTRSGGQIFPSAKIFEAIQVLDENYFLDNERFVRRKQEIEEDFAHRDVRPSAMAGRSYPADPAEVAAVLDQLFSEPDAAEFSPADMDEVVGVISPHIDFARGGLAYVPAYRALAKSDAETFVILGISHSGGATPLIPTRKDFETPLGRAETDKDLLDRIEKKLAGNGEWRNLYAGEFAHAFEHSIEFQILFLQYLMSSNGRSRPFGVLPVLCAFSHEEVQAESLRVAGQPGPIRSFLNALTAAIAEAGRRVAYIAGVDFAHVGAQFGDDFQVQEKELAFLKDRDEQMMALLAGAGPDEFHRFIADESNGRRVCGYPALYSFLSVLPPAAVTAGCVLKYGQWPDPNATVTFGSLAFRSKE